MTQDEWHVRILEEGLQDLRLRTNRVADVLGIVAQQQEQFRDSPYNPPTSGCTSNFSGQVRGCNSLGLPGASVSITGTGISWSGTTDGSGNYSGSVNLPTGASTSVTLAITESSGRFVTSSTSQTLLCGTTTLPTITLAVASGYVCWHSSFGCVYPIAKTLHLTDSVWGAVTLVWGAAVANQYSGTITVNYPACALFGCAAKNGVVLRYFINPTLAGPPATIDFVVIAGGCPTVVGGIAQPATSLTGPSLTCPTAFALSYSGITASVSVQRLYCSNTPSPTFTVTE